MPPIMPLASPVRRRKWIWVALAVSTQLGCIRFRNDAKGDAGVDSGATGTPDAESDTGTPNEGGDAVVIPPPVCDKFSPSVAESIAADLVTEVSVNDCRLRLHFAKLPAIAIEHFQECLAAQIGQVMGCRQSDGTPVRYPIRASNGQYCRDMRSSHMGLSVSDGDFDAFIADFNIALETNMVSPEDRMRILMVFGATRNDIVDVPRLREAGVTLPCDPPDAAPDTAPDAP
jgi:hypothetical protein